MSHAPIHGGGLAASPSTRLHLPARHRGLAAVLALLGLSLGASPARAGTEVLFNHPIDKRYAWLDNDATGDADFRARLKALIQGATTSIDICTMSFGGLDDVAADLAEVEARLGCRLQPPRTLRGGSGGENTG